ncbi:hypothetical protein A4A49_43307 [Nicotiana attenuata]|uniref:Carboxypeptidase A inhibitor-like domain-containing protein n=1 Tax=Nicotiana attenuata TaxID=49451 RepID=A0A1J6KA05_NICAT|nr:hypothetical protein A4A49_63808 [Nicotiana attenuata]OIT22772.1 hypothetical protein A4A49_43307 [Nicotiana attenuata]
MSSSISPIKFAFFIMFFSSINLPWIQEMTVMAHRDLPLEIVTVETKLLSLTDIVTCGKVCSSDSDCSDGWVCKSCKYRDSIPVPFYVPAGYYCT